MTGKELSFYAAVNGAGLQNLEIIDRICGKYYGVAPKAAREYSLAAIAFIEKYRPFSNVKKEKPILTGPPKIASKVDMRDYSGFSRQKKSKEWYKTKPKDRTIPPTPRTRQRPQTKPIKNTPVTRGITAFRRQPVIAQ